MFVLAACSQNADVGDQLHVVATTSVLGDVVSEIVGSDAVVEVLIPTGQDPHGFQVSAAQAASLREADLVIAAGLGLEEGLSDALENAESDGVMVLELAPRLEPIAFSSDPEVLDPHFWLDPVRMGEAVAVIGSALDQLDSSIDWGARAGRFRAEIDSAMAQSLDTLAAVPMDRRILITNHDALGYFAQRYNFDVVGTIVGGGSTQSDASPADIAELVGVIEELGIAAMFIDATASHELADAVAGELDFPFAVVELFESNLGDPGTGAETYLGMVVTNAERVAEALVSP